MQKAAITVDSAWSRQPGGLMMLIDNLVKPANARTEAQRLAQISENYLPNGVDPHHAKVD
jgi:hypothetical protein